MAHGAGKTSHNVYFPEDWRDDLEEIRRERGLRSATAVWVDTMTPVIDEHRKTKAAREKRKAVKP